MINYTKVWVRGRTYTFPEEADIWTSHLGPQHLRTDGPAYLTTWFTTSRVKLR
jgi:hypothetical protein